jgi:hypothetical protein
VAVVVVLVLLSAAIGALALVLMRKAAENVAEPSAFGLALLWSLVRHQPVWVAGIAAMLVELVLQLLALASGPVSVVQLLVVMELPFCLILWRLVSGGRLRIREWTAVGAMTIGVIVLLATLAPRGGTPDSPSLFTWLRGLAVTIGAIVTVLIAGRRMGGSAGPASAGAAAGMAAGLVAALVKPVTSTVSQGLDAVLGSWQAWAALVAAGAAFLLLQNALRAGRLVASQPGITLANPLVSAAWGVFVFHEQVRTGWWLLGVGLGAMALAAGAVLLSRSPLLAGHHEPPAPADRIAGTLVRDLQAADAG